MQCQSHVRLKLYSGQEVSNKTTSPRNLRHFKTRKKFKTLISLTILVSKPAITIDDTLHTASLGPLLVDDADIAARRLN
jgi:hypothetical protein